MNNFMIDLETLAKTPDAMILTIAVVPFDPRAEPMASTKDLPSTFFYEGVRLKDQMRRVDWDTFDWWQTQSEEARREVFWGQRAKGLPYILGKLTTFLGENPVVWCQGLTFDIPILEDAYRQLNLRPPWHYADTRDTRTVYDIAGGHRIPTEEGIAHVAWKDALAQAIMVQECVQHLTGGYHSA